MTMCMSMVMTVVMAMGVSVASQSPNQKADSCKNEYHPDKTTLLSFDLMPKLKPNRGYDCTQDHRGCDMTG